MLPRQARDKHRESSTKYRCLAVVGIMRRRGLSVALAAPTGRAAQRLTELVGSLEGTEGVGAAAAAGDSNARPSSDGAETSREQSQRSRQSQQR
jgi:hypothetical protein